MNKVEVAVVVGWFLLAAYVLYRCFTDSTDYDLIIAAWSGGVLSTVCYLLVQKRRRRGGRYLG